MTKNALDIFETFKNKFITISLSTHFDQNQKIYMKLNIFDVTIIAILTQLQKNNF